MKTIVSVIESERGVTTHVSNWLYTADDSKPILEAEEFFLDCVREIGRAHV